MPVPEEEEIVLQQALLRSKIVEGICEDFYEEFESVSLPNRLYMLLSNFILEVDNNGERRIPKQFQWIDHTKHVVKYCD